MKIINKLSAVLLGMSLLLGSGMVLANEKQEGVKQEVSKQEQATNQKSATKRAGDPIPDIDITLDQAQGVCQAGSDCDDGDAPLEPGASQKGATKFKAGKALAETVKKVDKGNDVKHIDEDSDDDGLPEQ